MIAPWDCKSSTKTALFFAFFLLVREDPPPVTSPLISAKSFTDIGIPSRNPFLNPTLVLYFDARAESRAVFLKTLENIYSELGSLDILSK